MIKKLIFALIATVLGLLTVRSFFTIYEPIEIKIDAQGKGREKITLSFTEKKYQSFGNAPALNTLVNLAHDQSVRFKAAAVKIESVRIKVNKSVKIKKITVTGQKTVSLTPPPSLKIPNINVKANHKINYSLFFICFVSLFFLFFEIFSYLSLLTLPKDRRSLPDVCFLGIFCFLLILPAANINSDKVSRWENKTLAKYKPLRKNEQLNLSFGKNFEEWFNDRFFLRKPIISFYGKIESVLKSVEKGPVLIGKNNFLFMNSKQEIEDFQNNTPFTPHELHKIIAYLKDVDEWCRKNGKHFYVLFAPDKHRIYDEFYPPFFQKKKPNSENPLSLIIAELKKTKIRFIDPTDELKKHKSDRLLYWKDDTHWNEYGSYIAYRGLINLIAKDFPSLTPKEYVFDRTYTKNDGDLAKLLPSETSYGISTTYEKHGFLFKTPHYSIGLNPKSGSKDFIRKNPKIPNAPKIVALMDSFFIGLSPYLGEHFSRIDELWQRSATGAILSRMEQADILLLEIRAGTAYMLKRATFNDEK